MKLSTVMERNLRRLYGVEQRGGKGLNLRTSEADSLERRGLVVARFNVHRGVDCVLTTEGRRVAREL